MLRQLARDSLTYGTANVLSRVSGLILLPVYARLLSERDIGAFDLIAVGATFINVTVALEITQGLARHLPATSDPQDRAEYAGTAFWFSLGGYSLFAVVALLVAPALDATFLGDAYEAELRLGIFSMALGGLLLYALSQLRFQLRPGRYAAVTLTSTGVFAGLVLLLVLGLGFGLTGVLIAQLTGNAVALGAALLLGRYPERRAFSATKLREMLAFSLPLVPSSVAVIVLVSTDRILINQLLSLGDVGAYGVAYRLGFGVVGLLMAGFQLAMAPIIYARHQDPETPGELARVFRLFVAAALVGVLGLHLFGEHLVRILATDAYLDAAPLIPLLGTAVLLSGMYIFAPGLAIAKRTSLLAATNILAALAKVALGVLLISAFGLIGAGVASVIVAAALFGATMRLSQSTYPAPHRWGRMLAGLTLAVIAGAVGSVLPPLDPLGLAGRLLVMVGVGLGLIRIGLVEPTELRVAARLLGSHLHLPGGGRQT